MPNRYRFNYKEVPTHEQTRSHSGHRRQSAPPHSSYLRTRRSTSLSLTASPGFNQDEEQHPSAKVVELKQRIRAADAVLIVTPEYNYSVPGVLKNAIDWASRPYGDSAWNGKPAAIMGASVGTMGTARAQYHLRQTFVFLNMWPLNQPEVMIGNAAERFDAEGNLTDETTKDFIRQLLQHLMDWTRRLSQPQAT
jgi:chromate reductase, NAD(P)H dehydrogenase (quinone)